MYRFASKKGIWKKYINPQPSNFRRNTSYFNHQTSTLMKILLFGEYSNLHATLATGLRELGHQVLVVSDGTRWRNYERDISLMRLGTSVMSGIGYLMKLLSILPRLRGFDIVQLINPDFVWMKSQRAEKVYRYLRRHNRKMFIGAFGIDWYWVDAGLNRRQFRYGDFYIGDHRRTDEPQVKAFVNEWVDTPKGDYCRRVMTDCDGIPACLYEYIRCYGEYFPDKTRFIPLPIKTEHDAPVHPFHPGKDPIRFFIGIDTRRSHFKGTDIMLQALQDIEREYPGRCSIVRAEHIPYEDYQAMMDGCDCILDQLYSYTPAMNALQAMSKGLVCIGGGEPENYDIIGESELRPIVNVEPTYESVFHELEQLILHPDRIPELKRQSIAYVKRHHDHLKVARMYEDYYRSVLAK